jgi:hypothetical protein
MELTEDQKKERIHRAKSITETLKKLGQRRYSHYAVEDETWIYHDPVYRSSDRKVWISEREKRPQFPKPKLGCRKSLLVGAFTCDKKFSLECLEHKETLNSERYQQFIQNTLHRWRNLRQRPLKVSEHELFWQHDNARPHVSRTSLEFFSKRRMVIVNQSPYSPDLNIWDRWLNKMVKDTLNQQSFQSSEDIVAAAQQALENIEETEFKRQLDLLNQHCLHVIKEGGCYTVE